MWRPRRARNTAVPAVAHDTVLALDMGHELLEEELFIGPALHVEIAVLLLLDGHASGIGRDDYHRPDLTVGRKLVHNIPHVAAIVPVAVSVAHAVQKVEDGVAAILFKVVARRQENCIVAVAPQHLAVDGVVLHAAHHLRPILRRRGERQARGGGNQQYTSHMKWF